MKKINEILGIVLDYVGGGDIFRKPFKWLYWLFGAIFALGLIVLIVALFEPFKYLEAGGKIGLILDALVLVVAAAFSVLYWIRRAKEVENVVDTNARYIAIPIIAHLNRTMGEFFGLLFGVFGTVLVLLAVLFGVRELLPADLGLILIIGCPIVGFINILFSRFVSESLSVVTSIANDTRVLAEKAKEGDAKAEEEEEEEEEV